MVLSLQIINLRSVVLKQPTVFFLSYFISFSSMSHCPVPPPPYKERWDGTVGTSENELLKVIIVQQVGTTLMCTFQGLFKSPLIYQFVIAGE